MNSDAPPGWEFHKASEDRPWADVVPLDDEQPHQFHTFEASRECHCKTRVDYADEDGRVMPWPMVVHFAFDGRHIVEQAETFL